MGSPALKDGATFESPLRAWLEACAPRPERQRTTDYGPLTTI
jgi:hypothetical protein